MSIFSQRGFVSGGLLDDEIGIRFDPYSSGFEATCLYLRIADYIENNATKEKIRRSKALDHIMYFEWKSLGLNFKYIPHPTFYNQFLLVSYELRQTAERIEEIITDTILDFSSIREIDLEKFINFLVLKRELNVLVKSRAIAIGLGNPLSSSIDYLTKRKKFKFISNKREMYTYSLQK